MLFTVLALIISVQAKYVNAQEVNIIFPDEIVAITKDVSEQVGVPQEYILAIMYRENKQFNEKAISSTGDYGLMQINKVNHGRFKAAGFSNIFDKRQNIHFGAMMIKWALDDSQGNLHKAFMTYNMGGDGAKKAMSRGVYSTAYSRYVVNLLSVKDKWVTTTGRKVFEQKQPEIEEVKPIEGLFDKEETDEYESYVFDPQ